MQVCQESIVEIVAMLEYGCLTLWLVWDKDYTQRCLLTRLTLGWNWVFNVLLTKV